MFILYTWIFDSECLQTENQYATTMELFLFQKDSAWSQYSIVLTRLWTLAIVWQELNMNANLRYYHVILKDKSKWAVRVLKVFMNENKNQTHLTLV